MVQADCRAEWDVRRLAWKIGVRRCFYCNKKLSRKNQTMDHFIPMSRGGPDKPKNRVWSCAICNRDKGCLLPEEFRVVVALRLKLLRKTGMRFPGELERL